jgi:hypothetical protein
LVSGAAPAIGAVAMAAAAKASPASFHIIVIPISLFPWDFFQGTVSIAAYLGPYARVPQKMTSSSKTLS